MLEKSYKNIVSLALLSLLFIGLMGRSISLDLPTTCKVKFSGKHKEAPVTKIEMATSAMALVPILNLDFPDWCSPIFFASHSVEVGSDFLITSIIPLQEKFLKILFQNIMAANAP